MLYMLISPAKKLAASTNYKGDTSSIRFKEKTAKLMSILQEKTRTDISLLMKLSEQLSHLNYTRYQNFTPQSYTAQNSFPAIFLFQGDVYQALKATTFNKHDIAFCQKSLGILSGLYGLLSPLDLIQPYRLEMGTQLSNPHGKDLIAFWQNTITAAINEILKVNQATYLINLASHEYSSVINMQNIVQPIIKINFKDEHLGGLKTIGIYTKRARGMMVNFIIKNRSKTLKDLKKFSGMNYIFNQELSSSKQLTFVR